MACLVRGWECSQANSRTMVGAAGEGQAVQGQGLHVDIGCGLWGLGSWKSLSG